MRHIFKKIFMLCSFLFLATALFVALSIFYAPKAEANIKPPKPDRGRPLVQDSNGGYYCTNCSGDDCGAACL